MAGRERDWMDYAVLGSSLAQNSQLSSIGDQLAALKQAESQKQFAEFEVTLIRQILFWIEGRIRYFSKQASYSPQGRMVGLLKLTEVLAAFNDPSFYRNYEDKDRHTALTTKVDEAVMEIARSLPPAELAEFNEAMAWHRTKLPLLAKTMQLAEATDSFEKAKVERSSLKAEYSRKQAERQEALKNLKPKLEPLERRLAEIESEASKWSRPKMHGCVMATIVYVLFSFGLIPFGIVLDKRGDFDGVLVVLWVLIQAALVWWVVVRYRAWQKRKRLKEQKEMLTAKISELLATTPLEPQLPPPPLKPSDENCERFLHEHNLELTFPELERVFAAKRALVVRVLEADVALSEELTELDARDVLHSTAQKVAAKMGMPLPPSVLGLAGNTPNIKSIRATIATKRGRRTRPTLRA